VGLGLLGLLVTALLTPDRGPRILGVGGLAAVLWSCYAINGGADLFVALPFAAVGAAAGLVRIGRRLDPRTAARLCAAAVVVGVVLSSVEAVTTRDHRLPTERLDVSRMVAAVPPGSTVLSLSAPEVLVLAHRTNPYPWQLSNGPISAFLDDHLPGGLAGYADRISRLHPALIAIGKRTADEWLLPVLDRDYTRVGSGSHWVWYAANDLGPATLRHLHEIDRTTWATS
jgi:hypothetical protein